MSATVVPLPPSSSSETVDFLRRMASMVSGRNGEMLLSAASLIESLAQRAMTAERLYHEQQESGARNAELREAAELASDAMVGQIETLRAQLADVTAAAAAERAAFDAERERWRASGQDGSLSEPDTPVGQDVDAVPEGATAVGSPVPGSVWKVLVNEGDEVSEGQTLAIVESMKMEFPVLAPASGKVLQVRCQEGHGVTAGQNVVVMAQKV